MAGRKLPNRVWICRGRVFKTEADFVTHIHESDRNEVVIYDEVERSTAGKLKTHIISQRERDEQLTLLLDDDDNSELKKINDFKNMLVSLKPEATYTKQILNSLKNIGMTKKAFERIVNHHRMFLLYDVSSKTEWYECLLKCHNFISIPIKRSYDYREKKSIEHPIPPENLEGFKLAKESLKKSKKISKKPVME